RGRRGKSKLAPPRGREPEAVAGVRPGPVLGPGPSGELGPRGLAGPAGRPTAFPLLADGPRGGGSGPGGGEAAGGPAGLRVGGRGRARRPRPAPAEPIWGPPRRGPQTVKPLLLPWRWPCAPWRRPLPRMARRPAAPSSGTPPTARATASTSST